VRFLTGRSERVDTDGMRLREIRASTRFFLSLFVLLVAVAAMAVLGLSGLAEVNAANRQVFSDNFLTAQATSGLGSDLGRVEVLSLQIAGPIGASAADRLRAKLDAIVIPEVDDEIAALIRLHAGDPAGERAQIARIPMEWNAFLPLTRGGLLAVAPRSSPAAVGRSATATAVEARLGPLIAYVSARRPIEVAAAAAAHAGAQHTYKRSRTWLIAATVLALLAAGTMIRAGLTLKRLLEDQAEEQRHGQSSSEYSETLQATENEDEAQELLRRQVERTHPGARAVVLARNNSADRLEPRTSLAKLDVLREPLEHATPRSCLAVRFARSHAQGGDRTPLTSCEVCGELPGVSTCEPLLVGGEVIGSVLVSHAGEPDRRSAQRIRETVAQAAPVLGNLRNLALAQLRAATDPLTGLPNQRAVQDTLKRMVAQASRTISPLAAVLVDLDHFKKINDIYGHDRGDEVLAAVGVAFRNVIRESDFVGRYGGEEFLILLPSTDTTGAIQVGEAVRAAITAIRIPSIEQPITASAGVAIIPNDAGDALTLFRAADRALYAAKNAGRNQVNAHSDDTTPAAAGPAISRPQDTDITAGTPGI
jgi:diguanylate cyclase (GGDEF)-like protein